GDDRPLLIVRESSGDADDPGVGCRDPAPVRPAYSSRRRSTSAVSMRSSRTIAVRRSRRLTLLRTAAAAQPRAVEFVDTPHHQWERGQEQQFGAAERGRAEYGVQRRQVDQGSGEDQFERDAGDPDVVTVSEVERPE